MEAPRRSFLAHFTPPLDRSCVRHQCSVRGRPSSFARKAAFVSSSFPPPFFCSFFTRSRGHSRQFIPPVDFPRFAAPDIAAFSSVEDSPFFFPSCSLPLLGSPLLLVLTLDHCSIFFPPATTPFRSPSLFKPFLPPPTFLGPLVTFFCNPFSFVKRSFMRSSFRTYAFVHGCFFPCQIPTFATSSRYVVFPTVWRSWILADLAPTRVALPSSTVFHLFFPPLIPVTFDRRVTLRILLNLSPPGFFPLFAARWSPSSVWVKSVYCRRRSDLAGRPCLFRCSDCHFL